MSAQVSRNASAILLGRGIAIGFSMAAAILLTRYLGSERLGQFASIYAYLALFSWIATFGFEPILIRDISRERGNASNLIYTTVILSYFLCVGTIAIALLLSPLADYTGFLRTLLVLGTLEFLFIPLRIPGVIFQVEMRQWYGSAVNVVRQALWLAVVVIICFVKAPLQYVVLGRVFCAFIEAILLWMYARRSLSREKRFLSGRARALFSHSFPIAFTSFVATIYLRIDQVMLHKMASDTVLGHYAAAAKVSELFELLPAALMSSMAPILSVVATQSTVFKEYIDTSFRYFMVLGATLCVFMTLGAKTVIYLFYGSQFLPAAPLLAILIWSEMAVFFATVVLNAMIARNLQRLLPWPTVIGAGLNIALNIVFIPKYSALGAAWATVVSYTVAWMLFLLLLRQTRVLICQGLAFAVPTALIALVSIFVAHLTRFPNWIEFLLALAICGGGMWLTGMVRVSDISAAREVFAKVLPGIRFS
jgi:polysaccharide transporter, PST family